MVIPGTTHLTTSKNSQKVKHELSLSFRCPKTNFAKSQKNDDVENWDKDEDDESDEHVCFHPHASTLIIFITFVIIIFLIKWGSFRPIMSIIIILALINIIFIPILMLQFSSFPSLASSSSLPQFSSSLFVVIMLFVKVGSLKVFKIESLEFGGLYVGESVGGSNKS